MRHGVAYPSATACSHGWRSLTMEMELTSRGAPLWPAIIAPRWGAAARSSFPALGCGTFVGALAVRIRHILGLLVLPAPAMAQAPVTSPASAPLEYTVVAAAFDALRSVGTPLPGPHSPFCARFTGWTQREAPDLGRLPLVKGPVLDRAACPPTYATWVRVIDSTGRDVTPTAPPGHIEPYAAEVWPPVLLAPGIMVVRMQVSRKLETWVVHCEVSVPDPRNTYCGTLLRLVH